ncbi:MAG: relaxase domain-containing protein, partial [Propionibacteriaceae bacterium]|nr:relaxase domain-containing protein [Propionibacteriaceae bacterium]
MTVSMSVMYAGTGYRYLLGSVAASDGDRDLSTPLTRYYTETGTPPGYWAGSGLAAFDEPAIHDGAPVTEQHLEMLIGYGVHPATGQPLGRRYPVYQTSDQRATRRISYLDPALTGQAREDAVTRIEAEERRRPTRRAVASYDYTFSVPKTVSVLWGLADTGTQQVIAQAHHDAVRSVLGYLERHVATTRRGVTAPATRHSSGGAVVQADVAGIAATCYDHYDSRTTDPQLHTHVVISNKTRTRDDGIWRSLDGRPLHASTVALSEHYNAILADLLTSRLGLGWEQRAKGRDRNPGWELAVIPQPLADLFSSRSNDIEAEKDHLIRQYAERHGHQPTTGTIISLRQQATRTTRPPKTVHSLADLTTRWRDQATPLTGSDPARWATRLLTHASHDTPVLLRADDIPAAWITDIAHHVIDAVSEKRATWRHWNLHAETTRHTMGWRFASPADRETVVEQITTAAEHASTRLTPAEPATPAVFTRPDGT